MNDDQLRELLRHADAASTMPPAAPGLAERVRGRCRRRNRLRAASIAAAALIIAAAGVLHLTQAPSRPVAEKPAFDAEAEAKQIAALEAQAAFHSALAEGMWRAESQARRITRTERTLTNVTPLRRIEAEADRTAMLAILDADRLLNALNQRDAAAAEYRRTIELFPQSHWASVARDRLQRIETRKEG